VTHVPSTTRKLLKLMKSTSSTDHRVDLSSQLKTSPTQTTRRPIRKGDTVECVQPDMFCDKLLGVRGEVLELKSDKVQVSFPQLDYIGDLEYPSLRLVETV